LETGRSLLAGLPWPPVATRDSSNPSEDPLAAPAPPGRDSDPDPAPGTGCSSDHPDGQAAPIGMPYPAPALFLASKGLSVSGFRQRVESEQYLDRCARFIGTRFQHLKEFCTLWKRSTLTRARGAGCPRLQPWGGRRQGRHA
jgi:hypothetical protein